MDFWRLFFLHEQEEVDESENGAFLAGLPRDFVFDGGSGRAFMDFIFRASPEYWLSIQYGSGSAEKTLDLVDTRTAVRLPMGWWDEARWHPYCLRLDEAELLSRYCAANDPVWNGDAEAPFLLLCEFIGAPSDAEAATIVTRTDSILQRLTGRPAGSVGPALRLRAEWRWEQDPKLGWVFTSDTYRCYSLRNLAHVGSDEASFPFPEFAKVMGHASSRGRAARTGDDRSF